MQETYFHYKIFDSDEVSSLNSISEEYKVCSEGKFKSKLIASPNGRETILTPTIIWNEKLRPSVGFQIETIEIGLSNFIPLGSGYKIFQHGYQSWSFSSVYSSHDRDQSPNLEFLRYSQENFYSKHSGFKGDFISEGFIILYSPLLNEGILLGVSKLSDPGVRFHTSLDESGRILTLSLILDYHSSPTWKAGGKIPTPEITVIKTMNTPEKAMESYFNKLSEKIPIPELGDKVPTGWCSWYYFYTKITEKDILENLREVRRMNLPIEFFQVDDGYQRSIGDWLVTNNKFPSGMKLIADEIKQNGYQPGIWLAPFLVRSESEFFQMYPEAVLKDSNGDPVPAIWNPLWGKDYTYCIDLTHPKSIEFLIHVFKAITKDWGYTYLKLDFLYAGLLPGQVFDPSLTPQLRYQNTMKLIRQTVGKNIFLLGCGAPLLPSIGYFQGMRISCDVAPFWGVEIKRKLARDKNALCTKKALINTITRAGMHRHLWYNDPDCLLVRKKKNSMSYNQTLLMAKVMAVSGGMLLVSDDLRKLEDDRLKLLLKTLELSKKCMKRTPIPLGLFQEPFPPALYNPSGFLGIWNFDKIKKKISIPLPFVPKNQEWTDYFSGECVKSVTFSEGTLIAEMDAFESHVFPLN